MKKSQKYVYIIALAICLAVFVGTVVSAVVLSNRYVDSAKAEVQSPIELDTWYNWYRLRKNPSFASSFTQGNFGQFQVNTSGGGTFIFNFTYYQASANGALYMYDQSQSDYRHAYIQCSTSSCVLYYRSNLQGSYTSYSITSDTQIKWQFPSSQGTPNYSANWWTQIVSYQLYIPTPTISVSSSVETWSYAYNVVGDVADMRNIPGLVVDFTVTNVESGVSITMALERSTDESNWTTVGSTFVSNQHAGEIAIYRGGFYRLRLDYNGSSYYSISWWKPLSHIEAYSYNLGYTEGDDFAENNNLISLVWAVFKMPFTLLFGTYDSIADDWTGGLFTTSVLGVDLRAFVLGIMSLCLVIRILRIVLGGSVSKNE